MSNPTFQWIQLQEAIFQEMVSGFGSFQVDAKAGSGKTTVIVEGLNRLKVHDKAQDYFRTILCLAFNKKIAVELEPKVPEGIIVKTLNALGHRAWSRAIGKPRLQLSTNKLYKIAQEQDISANFADCLALARAAKSMGLVPDKSPGNPTPLMPDTLESWEELAIYFDLEFNPQIHMDAREILRQSILQAYQGLIDFDDQIYMSALFGGTFDKFDLILVDEAQDLSLIQHKMLARSLSKKSRLIAVGDPNQAIYGFRGASAKSMLQLEQEFQMKSLPLSVSYRCPQEVVRQAQHYVPEIEPFERAPQGKVTKLSGLKLSDLTAGSAILCRNNAPLFALAFRLISQGKSCCMLGRDIGKGLTSLVKKLAPQPMPLDQLIAKLEIWEDKEIARKPQVAGRISDKAESIRALASNDLSDSEELCYCIEALFDKKVAQVTLSSIHRAKGLEWPTVYFLDSWRIPSKYAQSDWQIQQEYNLAYVAITRAQRELYYISLDHIEE